MNQFDIEKLPKGSKGFMYDWGSDQRAFKGVPWGKAMMWIFLLSDTFIFSCFLISLMTARASTVVPWPPTSDVFALTVFETPTEKTIDAKNARRNFFVKLNILPPFNYN